MIQTRETRATFGSPRNRCAPLLLASLHAGLVIAVIAAKPFVPYPSPAEQNNMMSLNPWGLFGTMIAARYFHFAYESALCQALALLDVPALLVGSLTFDLIAGKLLQPFYASYVTAANWLVLGSLQWFFLGKLVVQRWRKHASSTT